HARRVERGRRVVDRVEENAAAAERRLLFLPVDPRDSRRLAREQFRGEVAERRDDARADQLDLVPQVGFARLDLLGLRITVAGWTAFEDVRDVDVGARQPDRCQELIEQLAGRADERDALLVLVEARGL